MTVNYSLKGRQLMLWFFVAGLLSVVPFELVLGQEMSNEVVSDSVPDAVITTSVTDDVHSETTEDTVVDSNQEVVNADSSTTTDSSSEDTSSTTDPTIASTTPSSVAPELVETQPVPIPLEVISQAVASSSSNDALPFKLISSKMNFAINEVPSFTFLYESEKSEGPIESLVGDMISVVTETVSDLYEGSFIETIVDTVVNTAHTVVDFLVPTAEGQEVAPDVVQAEEPEVSTNDTSEPKQNSVTDSSASSTDADVVSSPPDTREDVSTTTATTTLDVAFAIIDTVNYPVSVTYTEEGVFVVDLVNAVFGIGLHTLELHIPFEDKMHVAYYTFSVDGTVISVRVLKEGLTVLVVADQLDKQTLWLEQLQENSVRSFQQIADESTMTPNPVLEFKDDTLFWTTPLKETLIGFDVVSKSSFSQTINLRASDTNKLELQNGTYDVSVTPEDIDVTFMPKKL